MFKSTTTPLEKVLSHNRHPVEKRGPEYLFKKLFTRKWMPSFDGMTVEVPHV